MQDEVFIQSLGPLSAKLQEQFPAGRFDVKSVSQFAAQIQQLTEDALGIKVCGWFPVINLLSYEALNYQRHCALIIGGLLCRPSS